MPGPYLCVGRPMHSFVRVSAHSTLSLLPSLYEACPISSLWVSASSFYHCHSFTLCIPLFCLFFSHWVLHCFLVLLCVCASLPSHSLVFSAVLMGMGILLLTLFTLLCCLSFAALESFALSLSAHYPRLLSAMLNALLHFSLYSSLSYFQLYHGGWSVSPSKPHFRRRKYLPGFAGRQNHNIYKLPDGAPGRIISRFHTHEWISRGRSIGSCGKNRIAALYICSLWFWSDTCWAETRKYHFRF